MSGPEAGEAGRGGESQRLDKWLWAARFFKTRSLAAAAVDGGKVKWNGHPAKPARPVRPGDRLEIGAPGGLFAVRVVALNEQRRPAPEARALYEETPESLAAREREQALRALAPAPGAGLKGRPTKRDGRLIRGFRGG